MVTVKDDSESEADADSEAGEIDLDLVSKARIQTNLRELKIPFPKLATLKGLVGLLATHYAEQHQNRVVMAVCERCGGVGPEALPACPFCGELNGAGGPASSVIGGGDSEVADSLTTIEHAAEVLAPVVGHSINTQPMTALARVRRTAGTEDQLEVAVGKIQMFKRTQQESSWDIGHQLNLINAEDADHPALWRLRKGPDGKAGIYDTFKAFLRAECGISARMAAALMHVASEYRRDQITLTGTSKLEVVLNAPEPERKDLLAQAATTPVRELREKVKQLNIAAGKHGPKRAARQQLAAKQAAPKVEKRDFESGLTTMVLAKPKGRAWLYRENKDAKGKLIAATQLSDNWGWIEGQNGVRLVLRVVKTKSGQLQVQWEGKREEVAAE
jgi:hypothetical protein